MNRLLEEIRPNILLLMLLVSVVLIVSAIFLDIDVKDMLLVFTGGAIGMANRLLDPPPDPSVPLSALKEIISAAKD